MEEVYYIGMENTSTAKLFSERRIAAGALRAERMQTKDADFLVRIAAEMLADRLNAITRDISDAVDIFSPFEGMEEELNNNSRIEQLTRLLPITANLNAESQNSRAQKILSDFGTLPFNPKTFNLATSIFTLHRSNHLPRLLANIREILKPDGVFLAVLPGDQTLMELRTCLIEAESELSGSGSLRVEPFGEIRQYGSLLQNAGFALPVVDSETFTVRYKSLSDLVTDLRAMGATSALSAKSKFPSRELFQKTEALLHEKYGDQDGKFRITAEFVFLSGWAPHESQQQPMKPGSASNKLKDFL